MDDCYRSDGTFSGSNTVGPRPVSGYPLDDLGIPIDSLGPRTVPLPFDPLPAYIRAFHFAPNSTIRVFGANPGRGM